MKKSRPKLVCWKTPRCPQAANINNRTSPNCGPFYRHGDCSRSKEINFSWFEVFQEKFKIYFAAKDELASEKEQATAKDP